jgi:troponin T
MHDSEERRKAELAQVEGELELLKQRQIERRKQREIEEAEAAERRRQEDEKRRQAIEESKARVEAEKARKQEEKTKRQQIMAGAFVSSSGVSNKQKSRTAEEQAEAKRNYLASLQKPDLSGLLPNDLKVKVKQLHNKILKLEADKYDLTVGIALIDD